MPPVEKALPTGTLTFLLSDVEGSTELWERNPAAMRDDLVRHDSLIEGEVERNHGTVVRPRGEGDSRFAVFPRATDAVSAACSIQVRFQKEQWKTSPPLRVRMALHTGEADLRDGDYYGSAVNRCARLRALAHGGQILLSSITAKLALESMTDGSSLRDLGVHHLKDLQQPEQVFQLMHPSLPSEFPPPRSLETFPNNLPVQLTSFIGREKEVREIKRLLSGTRLMTLTGAGGAGKTRLALQAAADVLESYPDGAWFVELASISDRALVPQAVASALGVSETRGSALEATLTSYLSSKGLLLLLDNCEHLINACAVLAEMLLLGCPRLRILATSREALAITGETVWLVPSLAVPDPATFTTAEPGLAASLSRFEAARLFVERAVAAQPSFVLTDRNAIAVAQICHRLDGIPLALELAAARVKALSAEQIAARLDDRFRFLTGGSRTALPRQQTLQAMIDWSYSLLTDPERRLFRRLSVFIGGWTLAAAETVCAGEGLEAQEVLDLLIQLVNKSLVVAEEQGDESRFRLLETIRQYARARLFESEEIRTVANRHVDFFTKLAEEAEQNLSSHEQQAWLDRLEAEHDNLRAAIEWSRSEEPYVTTALRLAASLSQFWYLRGMLSEGRRHLEGTLAAAAGAPASIRAKALAGAGLLAHGQGDYEHAPALAEESLALSRQAGDKRGVMMALDVLSLVTEYREDYERARLLREEGLALARELQDKASTARALVRLGNLKQVSSDSRRSGRALIEEGLALYRELGHKAGIAASLRLLGIAFATDGQTDRAVKFLTDSVTLSRELGDKGGTAFSTLSLAFIAGKDKNYEIARKRTQEAHALYKEVGNKRGIAGSFSFLGYLSFVDGNLRQASQLCRESLILYRELEEMTGAHYCMLVLAMVAEAEGRPERAVRLIAAARQSSPLPTVPAYVLGPFVFTYASSASALREKIGAEAFERVWNQGTEMSSAEAIVFALSEADERPT